MITCAFDPKGIYKMKKFFKLISSLLILILGAGCMTQTIRPPKPKKIETILTKHNQSRNDPYFWIKERTNPEVIDYLKKENNYTEEILKSAKTIENTVFEEIKSRVKEDESSAPIKRGDFEYQSQYVPGKQYPEYIRKNLKTSKSEVILDVNKNAEGFSFYQSSAPMMSYDQNLMAYAFDNQGRRFFTIKVTDLSSKKDLGVVIEKTTGNLVWSKNNNYFYYVQQDPETLRANKVFKFDIQKKQSTLVYEEKDDTFSVYLYQTLAKEYIFISCGSTLTTEIRYLKADSPDQDFKVFSKRTKGHEYDVYDNKDSFYIRSNMKADNFRLMKTSIKETEKEFWKELIPNRKDVYLEGLSVFKNFLVLDEKKDGLDQMTIYKKDLSSSFIIPFKDNSYTAESGTNTEFESSNYRFVYESMRIPEQTIDIDMNTHQQVIIKAREIPNYNSEKYKSERIWVTAKDGRKIPVSLLMSKDHKMDGTAPALIYAYGSYGASMTPWFSQSIFSLIDRGFVYAIAHIRGGSELGRYWYEEGRVLNKKNTFFDFIQSTEALIDQKYISKDKVFAMGGSAGGLLMGAITNYRPDLYRGIVAQVPFVDVVTTMLDESIPLTTGEYDEWGNPNEEKYYNYILSYSPYDNVTTKKYPNILVTTGLHDSQVQYWEPAKWVAKLRDNNIGDSKILLKTDMKAGHGGASGRYEKLKEKAFEFSFILTFLK